jgi:hypothetical protein
MEMQLELPAEEAQLLHRILSGYLSDLRMEVAGTDNTKFRQGLKDEEVTVKRWLAALAPAGE